MFRQGVREENSSLLLSGRFILGNYMCFTATAAVSLMEVEYRGILTMLKDPPQVLADMQQNESFSEAGNMNRREGGGGLS